MVPWAISVLSHPGENRKREAKGRLQGQRCTLESLGSGEGCMKKVLHII